MTILEFTIDGSSSANGAQTFTVPHTYVFRTLRLKHLIYSISNDNLQQTWSKATTGVSGPDRTVSAPLYLDVGDVPGVQPYDHYYLASSGSQYNDSGIIAFGHANEDSGTSSNTDKLTALNMTLINNEETSWAKDSTVTLAVKYASVETAGSFGLPQAFDSSSWDNSCRITVVLELDDMQQWDDGAGSSKAWVY